MRSRKHRIIIFLAIVFVVNINLFSGNENKAEKVDQLFSTWDKPGSPGCALGVIKDGKFIYKRGYGMANLEYNIPITSKSIFRIGSTSKQFTAMCITLLEEEKKLSIDDSMRKFLPEMPAYAENIKIHHLIHHTSGIRDYLTLLMIAGAREDDYFIDEEIVAMLARQKELNFSPGEDFLYSNSGYFLLSEIVKRITGKTMREFAEEKIFKPLGMNNTHFHNDHNMIVKNRASGYARARGNTFQISMTNLDMIGDGGIFTCVDDLLLWDRNFYDNKLGKGGMELIKRVQTPGKLNRGEYLDYAFGLGIGTYKGLKTVSHGGAFVGFRADMLRFPDQKFSVICLANINSINPSRLVFQVADVYLADQFQEESKKSDDKKVLEPKAINLPEEELKAKAGSFINPKTKTIWTIELRKGKLSVETPSIDFLLIPVGENTFIAEKAPVDIAVEFLMDNPKKRFMHVRIAGREMAVFEPVQIVTLTPVQLNEYVGEYYSEEVDTVYMLFFKDGKLYFRHKNPYKDIPKSPLKPALKDHFLFAGRDIWFSRDDQGRIRSFVQNAGRVKNIRFVKR